jgi:hypothetical protein
MRLHKRVGIRSSIGAEFLTDTPYKPSSFQDLTIFPVIDNPNANYFTWWKQSADPAIVWVSGTGLDEVNHLERDLPVFRILDSELEPGTDYHFELEVKDAKGPIGTNITRKTHLFPTNDFLYQKSDKWYSY